jgi:hypothetical protein
MRSDAVIVVTDATATWTDSMQAEAIGAMQAAGAVSLDTDQVVAALDS